MVTSIIEKIIKKRLQIVENYLNFTLIVKAVIYQKISVSIKMTWPF